MFSFADLNLGDRIDVGGLRIEIFNINVGRLSRVDMNGDVGHFGFGG